MWNPEQKTPSTPWERRIDELMRTFAGSTDEAERVRLFGEVQREFAGAMPVLYFAAPRVFVGMSNRVGQAQPALLQPSVLWNADRLTAVGPPR